VKHLLAGIAVTAIMAGSAMAADMPLRAVAPISTYDWSGMYIGGVIGGQWNNYDTTFDPLNSVLGVGTLLGAPATFQFTNSGFIGGIEAGDRYQFGKLVVGWEADMVWGNVNGTGVTSFAPGGVIASALAVNSKWTGTTTSSVGIAHDRWLIYGKAGVAWTNNSYTGTQVIAGIPLFAGTATDNRVGWTVGTGVEWAIWDNWSVKAEYDYLDFGTRTVGVNGAFTPVLLGATLPVSHATTTTEHVNQFKAGLNWRFAPNFW
jgi:outer membrane immunogenic protein